MSNVIAKLPGVIAVLLIAIVSFMISSLHPSFDSLVLSIIFGMLIANLMRDKEIFNNGVAFVLKVFLPLGIALYGTQLSFAGAEPKFWLYVIGTFIALFSLTYLISKGIGLSSSLGILLSTGISVCGASAIAIVSPLTGASKEETSISVISVMLIGIAGMIFYPILSDALMLGRDEFAFLSGATLPMLGQVKTVASAAGQEVLEIALKLKLIRIACLIFLPFVLIFSGRRKRFYVPWFIVVFFVFAIVVNTLKEAESIKKISEHVSRFLLSASLAAIGLSVDFDSITEEGAKPLLAVFLSWAIVVLLLYLAFSIG